jgi:signal transduction histidine kinase
MNRLKQLKTYPFGLFLILEWIFLGATIFGEWPDEILLGKYASLSESSLLRFSPFFTLLCLILLGLMGLRLPQTNKNSNLNKWLYILLQLGLLWLPFLLNPDASYFFIPYLIIIIRGCLIFELKESLLATLLIIVVNMLIIVGYYPDFHKFQALLAKNTPITFEQYQVIKNTGIISYILMFGLCSTVVLILINALQRECESRQKLDIAHHKLGMAHQKLREYAMLAEDKAILDERNRIAREIHDSLGHALTAQSIQLDNAIAFWQLEPTKAYSFLTEAKTLVTTALREIRYSVAAMRADPLQDKDLATAINLLCQEFSQRSSIVPQCLVSLTYPLSNEVKTTLYRIVQEALTNISKHSEATEVLVELQTLPEHLSLLIKDNGTGFDPQQNITGFGLQGMRERVIAQKGCLQMSSDFGCGCTITINIPRKQSVIS